MGSASNLIHRLRPETCHWHVSTRPSRGGHFHLASRLHNVTRVAERLGVSQPNVTVAIKKLEEELGIQLFDRRRKRLILTAEGKVFLSRIAPVLQDIQGAVQELNDYKQMVTLLFSRPF